MTTSAPRPETDESTGPPARPARRFAFAAVTLSALAIAAAVAGAFLLSQVLRNDAVKTRNTQAIDTAKQVVVNLTTLRKDTAKNDIDRILSGTTGDFRTQFVTAADSFQKALVDGHVDTTGVVDEAGLVAADGSHATVLIAATSTVKNTDTPQGQPRVYRMKVTLEHATSWLVSNVEFVA
jgi:Mce-associated membrane protein